VPLVDELPQAIRTGRYVVGRPWADGFARGTLAVLEENLPIPEYGGFRDWREIRVDGAAWLYVAHAGNDYDICTNSAPVQRVLRLRARAFDAGLTGWERRLGHVALYDVIDTRHGTVLGMLVVRTWLLLARRRRIDLHAPGGDPQGHVMESGPFRFRRFMPFGASKWRIADAAGHRFGRMAHRRRIFAKRFVIDMTGSRGRDVDPCLVLAAATVIGLGMPADGFLGNYLRP
jgi:hypothetical protein